MYAFCGAVWLFELLYFDRLDKMLNDGSADIAREARHNYLKGWWESGNNEEKKEAGAAGLTKENDLTSCVIDQRLPPRLLFKIVLAGDSGVGKTSLMNSFCGKQFDSKSDPTIGVDFCTRKVRVSLGNSSFNNPHAVNGLHFNKSDEKALGAHNLDNSPIAKLQIWDTAGHERFASITQTYFRDTAGCILMYDAASEITASSLSRWLERLHRGSPNACVIIVAGKCDTLGSSSKSAESEAAKSGILFSATHGVAHVCVSCKSGLGVSSAFQILADIIFRERVFPRLTSGEPLHSITKLGIRDIDGAGSSITTLATTTWSLGQGIFMYGSSSPVLNHETCVASTDSERTGIRCNGSSGCFIC